MKRSRSTLSLVAIALVAVSLAGCNEDRPQSSSGVQKATVKVAVNPNTGRTVEQDNIAGRLKMDNTPGSIKHLYIIAPESGQVIIYSTVQGKVTSSGKRLSPKTVNSSTRGFSVLFGNETHYTSEVLQDDGTYGSSAEYIFWFDSKGQYHQHYFTGGQIIHISDQPIAVKSVVINMELTVAPGVVVPVSPALTPVAPAASEKK